MSCKCLVSKIKQFLRFIALTMGQKNAEMMGIIDLQTRLLL